MEPILSLQDVGVRYQRRGGIFTTKHSWAIKSASFEIRRGEALGIVGSNGAGKSTILRVIAGIIQPDKGEVRKFMNYTTSLLALQVGFVPYLSGRENIFLSGMVLGMSRRELITKFDDIIDFSELGAFIDEPVMTYSVGMKARLGFAISFQADPDILLIDEVLGVGDAAFKQKSATAMKRKIRANKTVVLASHNENTIRELCHRVVWIEKGETVGQGKPDVVLKQYREFIRNRITPGPAHLGQAVSAG